MKRKRHFTLVELVIVVIIFGLLATFAIPGYLNVVERAKETVCENNSKVLLGAVNIYALENDQLPGTLGQLKQEHLEKSWAKYLEKEGSWKIKLAYFIVNFTKKGRAYAQTGWLERYVDDIKYFTCPADDTPPPEGHSYGINSGLGPITYNQYKNLPNDTIIISDSESTTFPPAAMRHKIHKPFVAPRQFAIGIAKNKEIKGRSQQSQGIGQR